MRNETHKKARWRGAIKKKGRERESGGGGAGLREREGGRLNTIGEKKAEPEKRSLKTQQMTSSGAAGKHNSVTAHRNKPRRSIPERDSGDESERKERIPFHTCVKQYGEYMVVSRDEKWSC